LKRNLLSLMLAAVLGVTMMLAPLLLLHTGMKTMGDWERATYVSKSESGKIIATPKLAPPTLGVILPEVALIVILGAIPAAVTFILIKRRLKA